MKRLYSILLTMSALTSFAQGKSSIGISDHIPEDQYKNYSVATFAAGCFWHEEALFESIKGVKEAVSGYAGGTTENPTYELVKTGKTGYAETVNVYYDPNVVSYATLVEVYFAGQSPTQVNGQGNDLGTQYRSIAFYRSPIEKQMIENRIKTISSKYSSPIATQVAPFTKFWVAEDYHQNYIENNMHKSVADYIHVISIREIKKFQKEFPQLIKPDHFY